MLLLREPSDSNFSNTRVQFYNLVLIVNEVFLHYLSFIFYFFYFRWHFFMTLSEKLWFNLKKKMLTCYLSVKQWHENTHTCTHQICPLLVHPLLNLRGSEVSFEKGWAGNNESQLQRSWPLSNLISSRRTGKIRGKLGREEWYWRTEPVVLWLQFWWEALEYHREMGNFYFPWV